jgi:hypothetical protein
LHKQTHRLLRAAGARSWLGEAVTSQRSDDQDERLRDFLGVDPPASVTALDPAVRAELADIVLAARSRQTESLREAFEATLKHVPLPARKIVKKVLGG